MGLRSLWHPQKGQYDPSSGRFESLKQSHQASTMPIVLDLLQKQIGYKFFSKLDISMQYWTFELDEESKDLCTIVTPFGTYRHCQAPMGLQNTPGFAQAQMVKVLRGIDEQDCYIDDIGVWDNDKSVEKELLSMVMVLKQYRTILDGAELHIYTDHKNLTFHNFNTQRVLCWRCYIKEYHPRLFYIEGKSNILADAFSRLPWRDKHDNEAVELNCLVTDDWVGCCRSNPAVALSHLSRKTGNEMLDSSECFFGDAILDKVMLALPTSEKEVYECFFNVPNIPIMQSNPLSMKWIADRAKNAIQKLKPCEMIQGNTII